MKWKIVCKWVRPNVVDVGLVFMSGESVQIGRFMVPNDGMVNNTVKCTDIIVEALKKRYRESC